MSVLISYFFEIWNFSFARKIWTYIFYIHYKFFRQHWMSHMLSKNASFGYLILVAIDIVSNVLHETDLVRCRTCQKTAEPLSTPDCHQPPRVRPRRVIELGSGLFQANTRRAFRSPSWIQSWIRAEIFRQDREQNIFIKEESDDD